MRKSVCRQVVLAIGVALLYSACGSRGSGDSPGNALDFRQIAPILPQAGSKAASAEPILAHEGAGWDDYFPIQRMDTQWNPHGFGDSMSGVFMPVGSGAEEFAFAAYSFIINELNPPEQSITFKWGSAPPIASRMWIGLSRPSGNSGHFEWYQAEEPGDVGRFVLPEPWANYTLTGGRVYVAVALTCDPLSTPYPINVLDWIRLGVNLPPSASLTPSTPPPYEAPATIFFTASGSTDEDGYISTVYIDWDGANEWGFYSYELYFSDFIAKSFDWPGVYEVAYYVEDDEWATDGDPSTPHVLTIAVVGNLAHGEIEDNDDFSDANQVSFPLSIWRGSLGSYPPFYVGYDGDNLDIVKFSANQGQHLHFVLDAESTTAEINIILWDSARTFPPLEWGNTPGADETIDHTFATSGEFYMELEAFNWTGLPNYSDYACSATLQ